AALASGEPVPLPHQDPDVLAAVRAAAGAQAAITGLSLAPGPAGTDLEVKVYLAPGCAPADASEMLGQLGAAVTTHVTERLSRRQSPVASRAGRRRRAPLALGRCGPGRGWLPVGESHGRALVAICEGMPAGVQVTTADIAAALARRRAGYGRGARMKFEQDEAEITGGVRHGLTLGGPVAIRIGNTEWPKWETVMSPDPVPAGALDDLGRAAPLTRPRPGHADLAGMQKYGHRDARPVLERASARETAARVALGELARRYLRQAFGIEIVSHVVAIGPVSAPDGVLPGPQDAPRVDADPVRCLDPAASAAMQAEIDAARKDGDTLGGVVEVIGYGVPPGLGSHVHWDRRLDARLAAALMSIHAIKGVEAGDGFATARRRGSCAHDEIEGSGDGVRRR